MSLLKDLISESGGAASAFDKDTAPGATVAGKIVSVNVRQVNDIATGKPQTWDDGNPKQQVVVTLQTDLRDPGNPEDDGARSIYVKWWGLGRQALLAAVRAAGADDLEVGGQFAAQYVGEGEVTTKGFNPPKIYKYEYRKPSATAGLLGGAPGVPPSDTATVTTPAGTHTVPSPGSSQPSVPAATSVPAGPAVVDPSAIAGARALLAQNLPDEVIRQAFPSVTPELLAALRNAAA